MHRNYAENQTPHGDDPAQKRRDDLNPEAHNSGYTTAEMTRHGVMVVAFFDVPTVTYAAP